MLEKIITVRSKESWPSWDLVYEWEDVFARQMNLRFQDSSFSNRYVRYLYSYCPKWIQSLLFYRFSLQFELVANHENTKWLEINKYNIIPWLVDCYARTSEQIKRLERNYSKNKYVLISSREVYDHLKNAHCRLPISHIPLSLPDKYKITPVTKFEKEYDVVLMGRQNPVLGEYLLRYADSHPSFTFLRRERTNGRFLYYDQVGTCVGDADTREHYMDLIRKSRVGIYSTPGMDDEKPETNGFSQVTPRFLEYISAGTHIIARYLTNSDTDFFELKKFSPSIDSYEEFCTRMDWALSHEVDMSFYSQYLSKHYTSVRVGQIVALLSK